ncbi:DUF7010 family protein [Cohnella sp. 56]|uniref:DUF7010 family protein n=1 Tax=Cohnella sp. 56 TaxID=3113722 RepID=UPI0030E7B7D1
MVSKSSVIGAANGVIFMTFFGALWSSIGIVGAHGLGAPWSIIFAAIVTLILLSGAISLFGKARSLSQTPTPEEREQRKKLNKRFGMIGGLEGLAICVASIVCNSLDKFEFFFPIMAIIVGIHFFPLARLFREKFYNGTGVVLCVLGVITFFLPADAAVNDVDLIATSVFIGCGSALTLWVTGLRIWTVMLKQLKR